MKHSEVGLIALLSALFFAIVVGGSVTLDAQPLSGPLSGILWTALAALAFATGVFLLSVRESDTKRLIGTILVFVSGSTVAYDLITGGDAHSLVRLVCSLFVFGGFAYVLVKNRVMQLPSVLFNGPIIVFIASMAATLMLTEFRATGFDGLQYWLLCVGGYFLTTSVVGRVAGPRMIVETIVAATSLVALKGIIEYLGMRVQEPTFRIFADWNNPNALAGMLVGAVPLAIGIALSSRSAKRALFLAGATVISLGLFLTQSKGGLLVLPIGLVVLVGVALIWRARAKALLAFVPLVAGIALFFLLQPRPAPPVATTAPVVIAAPTAATAPLQRVINPQGEAMQSSEYRKLLWKGAVTLIKEQVVGYGPGSYRFYSAKAVLTEQTQLAHQSYLQIGVEGGVLPMLAVLFLACVWFGRMFKGAASLSSERNMLRAGVVASVAAIGANGFLESNFFYLGTGFCLFVLLAVGLQLAADGTSPESMPLPLRLTFVTVLCAAPLMLAIWATRLELSKVALVTAIRANDRPGIIIAAAALTSVPPLDDEAIYLLSAVESDPARRISLIEQAVAAGPRTKNLRALADEQASAKSFNEAVRTLERALVYDPNNLRTLAKKMEVQKTLGDTQAVANTARAIIAVEGTTYLKVRAIPELVQTEPFFARLELAGQTNDQKTKAKLLREALEGFVRYRATTVPKILEFAKAGFDYGSETVETARSKMASAQSAATELLQIYRTTGDVTGAEEVRSIARGLALD